MSPSPDPLVALIVYDPIAVPASAPELRELEARFEAALEASDSPSALVLALEGLPLDEERRWLRDACYALEPLGQVFARLAALHRRREDGTLGAYDGRAFDRARGIAGTVAAWERTVADPATRAQACSTIRGCRGALAPTYRAILVERARWGTYPRYAQFVAAAI